MTSKEPESQRNIENTTESQDDSSLLWKRYQQQRQKSSRIMTTGLGVFAGFVLFLLAIGLWIVVVR